MVSRPHFEFSRQRIIVAGEFASAGAVIDSLRRDGHFVTHARGDLAVTLDLALGECHLLICGSGTDGGDAIDLLHDVRKRAPGLPILGIAGAGEWTPELEARLPGGITILLEPFSTDMLRTTVRRLLPLLSIGTTLAWRAENPLQLQRG